MYRLEHNEMVFVSAPTSAGKTVIAQYAIALSRQHKMRAIYTSPIKALSNQKYRDFTNQFGDVGILTGDVVLNRDASILVMTTEILRSMLYRGADLLRDVDAVIFDECHYIADDERGVVWEESIIMMPPHITMVFLSATIPNDLEIASWIARTKNKNVWVERHLQRPVPLVHSIYAAGQFRVLQEPNKSFNSNSFASLKKKFETDRARSKSKKPLYTNAFWRNLIQTFQKEDLLPCLMFSFSQKLCERLADILSNSNILLIDDKQSAHVQNFFNKAISRLKPIDKELPQVLQVQKLLLKGIGIHHGGMIPILKECVEILLAEGYVKILFCTSTFAMGINVPARSCAFTGLRKFNGKEFVYLTPTEYVQMSGRAGRRGLDNRGYAIIVASDELADQQFFQNTFNGKVEQIQSQFYFSINMVLSAIRTQGFDIKEFMKRTLSLNKIQTQIPKWKNEYEELTQKMKSTSKPECPLQAKNPESTIEMINSTDIEDIGDDPSLGFAMLISKLSNITKQLYNNIKTKLNNQLSDGQIILTNEFRTDICVLQKIADQFQVTAFNSGSKILQKNISLNNFIGFFENTVPNFSREIISEDFIDSLRIKPIKQFLNTNDFETMNLADEHTNLLSEIIHHPCFKCSSRQSHYQASEQRIQMISKVKDLKNKINAKDPLEGILASNIDYLKHAGYISNDIVLQLKGRISLEIKSMHEILGTELLTSGFFSDLTIPQIAALVSALTSVNVNAKTDEYELLPEFEDKINEMTEIAQEIGKELFAYNIVDSAEDFVDKSITTKAIELIYYWASGCDFYEIVGHAHGIPEGSIMRIILNTNDGLKGLASASKVFANLDLAKKFTDASEAIARDIVITPSLYFDGV